MNEEISEKNKTAKLQNLPEGWKWARLAEVVEESLSGEWGEDPTLNNSLYPVISTLAIDYEGNINFAELVLRKLNKRKLKKLLLRKNDILLEKSGGSSDKPAGKVALVKKPFEGTCSNFIQIIRVKKKYSPVFVFYKMFSDFAFRKTEKFQQKTTGIINFKINEYFSEMVPLPPLPEQQKIAEILETVDNAREKTDQIIEKYKRIKQGLMQELLTKGIDENGKIRTEKTHRFKDSPLGRIPEEWEVKRLGEVISQIETGTWGDEIHTNYNNVFPIIRSTEIDEEGRFDLSTVAYRSLPYKKAIKYILNIGDILLVASSGSPDLIGRAAIIKSIPKDIKLLFSNFMLCIRSKNNIIISKFLFYILRSSLYCSFLSSFRETTTGLINFPKSEFENFEIPLPPLPEQQRIAEILSQIDEVIEKETQYRDKLKRLKAGLMEDLLTGKVRVNKLIKQGA